MFALGALLYALPAAGWFLLMRSHSLAAIGVFYSAATLLLLAALGTLVFRESFGLREAAGVGLALAAVLVMAGG
jgi:undecaprenyl phosphate-alpha-L-ara4N flippase subunit ArnF